MASGKQEMNPLELGVPQWKKELLQRRRTLTRAITSAGGMVKLTVTCPTALRADSVPVVQSYGKHLQCTLQSPNCSALSDFHPDSTVRTMRLLDADLPGSELIAINCNSNSDSDLKVKMVEEKPDKKPTFKNMEKQKEEKNSKSFTNINDIKNEDDYQSDSSEELQYGPGIVNKLKSKYMSMTLRDNQKYSARPSLSNLRRATSLENMLDDDSNRLQQKPHFIKKPYHSSTQRSSKISQHHAKYLGLTRGSESMKRARSMDTLLKSDSKTNLNQLSNSLLNKSVYSNGIITPSIINEDLIIVDNCSEAQEENKLISKVEDKELPPQDLVKQTLKIFETSSNNKQSADVQIKVKTATNKLSNSNSRPSNIENLSSVKATKPSLSPKPLLSPEKRFVRPKVSSPKRFFPVVSSIDKAKAPVIAPRVLSPSEAKKFPFSPKILSSGETRKFIIPSGINPSSVKSNGKERTVPKEVPPAQNPKETERLSVSPINLNNVESPLPPNEDKPKYISQNAMDRISKEGLSMKFCFSDKVIHSDKSYLPQNVNQATNTALISAQEPSQTKQVAVIRPVVKNKMLTEQEIEKNLINKAKTVESKVVNSEDSSGVSEKPQLWGKKPWQSQNTMVFNFSDRKSVPDYIENDGLTMSNRRGSKCNGEETDGGGSGEEDWDPPLTCNVRFIGDNILINGKSSLKKEPRPSKLRIQFNDEATTLFEYPSEESMSEEISSPTPSSPLPCSTLSNYTPSKSASGDTFELGVTRTSPTTKKENETLEVNEKKEEDGEDYLKPVDPDEVNPWSHETTADILF
ncbi:uncharacterized protein bif [Halyomorpha halys]|uniref:uncharacterized protein bif n=1 Tax=Halyomorpha halys TaxID=286706 RepID=UPI0006D5289B|nr:uncharacterized protein LOC106681922 [Halyomorpha halys]